MARALLRIAAIGLLTTVAILAGGVLLARSVLGSDTADARDRIETEVRQAFAAMTVDLREVARMAGPGGDLRLATSDDAVANQASMRLFESVAKAVQSRERFALSLTLYRSAGRPVAWAGRPTEFPATRLTGDEQWFLHAGELGVRLVYVGPVLEDGMRVGTVAAERPIRLLADVPGAPRPPSCRSDDALCFPTRLGPVTIELPDAATARPGSYRFAVDAPSGQPLFTAAVHPDELAATRDRWWRATVTFALTALAITLLLLIGPVLDVRNHARRTATYAAATGVAALLIVGGRWLLSVAPPAGWTDARLFSGTTYASWIVPGLLTSAFDFLLTWLAIAGLVALALVAVERWRLHEGRRRLPVDTGRRRAAYFAIQAAAGTGVAFVLIAHGLLLQNTMSLTTLDLVHFSLQPWDASRTALQVGLIVAHATVAGVCVLLLRAALVHWRIPRHDWRLLAATLVCWILPIAVLPLTLDEAQRALPPVAMTAVIVGAALMATRLKARYRHGSQAFRLMLLTLALIVPAVASYPTLFHLARQAKVELVETRFAREALTQRDTMLHQLELSLAEIDEMPNLLRLIQDLQQTTAVARRSAGAGPVSTELAFDVWQNTSIGLAWITSSIEIYGSDGRLLSRFAFNLPEDLTASRDAAISGRAPRPGETACTWGLIRGEVAPFFAEDRRMLHAGRAFCTPNGTQAGSIVVLAMLDFENLPFISSRTPYRDLWRPRDSGRADDLSRPDSDLSVYNLRGRDVEFAFYGWTGRQLYPTGQRAWDVDESQLEHFVRLDAGGPHGSSTPAAAPVRGAFWTQLYRDDVRYEVYLDSDRSGIYALGFPSVGLLGHLVNLAELTVLAALTYIGILLANAVFGWVARRKVSAPALLREIRASFYRKLFLAFVIAVILPVGALALITRNYVVDEMRAIVEQEAISTVSAAQRLVEDLAGQLGVAVDDNLMVSVSRVIDQDANVFDGESLLATSERDLFASGLLPVRAPADVYYELQLRNERSVVTEERVGTFDEYLVAATPLTARPRMMLTVPLTSRQRDIENQITTLNRRLLLGALLFVLAGAFLGYWMAERISDPVNRLTRATRRIARGDLDARIIARSSDELRRLVEDFNGMATELQRQRRELEKTHRIEAWAEMARQVAHDIKNPLTPIQLTAEHLRRVHADRGEPLSPVLQECVGTILTQVRLLRQIAAEFSSFASSPIARPTRVEPGELLREIIESYRIGLQDRISFAVDVPGNLPPIHVDRTLVTRALTNLIENALHAMPGRGTLTVTAHAEGGAVVIRVGDTGAGMDAEALARAFEPYFSTKSTGTGLGLTIAKRNVELNGGTIAVESERDRGTTVELRFPAAVTSPVGRGFSPGDQ